MKELETFYFEKKREVKDVLFLRDNYIKLGVYYFLCIISALFVYVLVNSVQDLKKYLYDETESIETAQYVFLVLENNGREVIKIQRLKAKIFPRSPPSVFLVVNYANKKYYYSKSKRLFRTLGSRFASRINKNSEHLTPLLEPLDEAEYQELRDFYGANKFTVAQKSIFRHFFDYVTQPRYLFNMCAAIYFVTYETQHAYFAKIIFQLFLMFFIKRWEYVKETDGINKTCNETGNNIVYRRINGTVKKLDVSAADLTVGDIVEINCGDVINFDCVIFSGTCVVDQSTLTGETIPIVKRSIIEGHSIKIYNTVLAGSQCLQTKSKKVFAIVTGTGFDSFQGNLISGMTAKKYMPFKFYEDLTKLFSIFLVVYLVFLIYIIIKDIRNNKFSFDRSLLMFVILGIQSFPLSIYVSLFLAERMVSYKMKKYNIQKASTDYIVKAGRMNLVCFDKTGTLTEDRMKLKGLIVPEEHTLGTIKSKLDDGTLINQRVTELMACCHSLDIVDGKISGDPIEVEIQQSTGFTLRNIKKNDKIDDETLFNDPNYFKQKQDIKEALSFTILPSEEFKKQYSIEKDHSYSIVRYIHFDATRRRMSIVVNNPNNTSKYIVFMKGAPEVVPNHCNADSISSNYDDMTENYSKRGFRLLAMCYKEVDSFEGEVSELEANMQFLGLLVFINPLKEGVRQVIHELRLNDIQTIMITGDALTTAINVGYSSSIIDKHKLIWVGQLDTVKKSLRWYQTNKTDIFQDTMTHAIKETETVLNDSITHSGNNIENDLLKSDIAAKLQDCIAYNYVLALDGDTIEYLVDLYFNDAVFLELLFNYTLIFGRTSPYQKKIIVKYHKQLRNAKDFTVGFVGDGANDAEALHEANIGLSLGNQLSSMVASYYTEEDKIEKIKPISIEGKFALTFSIEILAFTMYTNLTNNFTMLFIGLFRLNYTGYEFFCKLAFNFPLYVLLAFTGSSDKLTYNYPEPSFLRKSIFIPFLVSTIVLLILTLDLYLMLQSDVTFKEIGQIVYEIKKVPINEHNFFQNKIMGLYWMFRSLCMTWAVSIGLPFKKSVMINTWAVGYTLVLLGYNTLKFFDTQIDIYWYQMYLVRIVRWPNMHFSTALKYLPLFILSGLFTIAVYQVGISYFLLKNVEITQKAIHHEDKMNLIYRNTIKKKSDKK